MMSIVDSIYSCNESKSRKVFGASYKFNTNRRKHNLPALMQIYKEKKCVINASVKNQKISALKNFMGILKVIFSLKISITTVIKILLRVNISATNCKSKQGQYKS